MEDELKVLRNRINELNKKATQVLVFLSFALAAAILRSRHQMTATQKDFLRLAIRHWAWAIFPTIAVVAPMKELGRLFRIKERCWFEILRWLKFVLLLVATGLIGWGTWYFLRAVGGGWPFM